MISILISSVWARGGAENSVENMNPMEPVPNMTKEQCRTFWITRLSQVGIGLSHFPIPFKVIGDRVLPLVSLIGILTYWALGLAVPNLENIPQGSFSKCTSPAGRLGGA